MRGAAVALVALAALASCALTSKAPPREQRYFAVTTPTGAAAVQAPGARLRLGRVTASAHLRYPIEHRTSEVEIAPYETLRWTELPDAYVRRSLAHALYEARPFEQATGGAAPALDVEILAFEEIARPGHRGGRVRLRYELHDDRRVVARGVVTIERDATGPSIDAVVPAIGSALDAATAELADRVGAAITPATAAP